MTIQYKVKVKEMVDGRKYITYKKKITRHDFVGKPHEHRLYNCDFFHIVLMRAHTAVIGEYKTWDYIDNLPGGVSIDTSSFLAIVTITSPDLYV